MQPDRRSRLVRHYQFTSWPDHGVPDSPMAALDFVKTVRSQVELHHGPLIVHCRYIQTLHASHINKATTFSISCMQAKFHDIVIPVKLNYHYIKKYCQDAIFYWIALSVKTCTHLSPMIVIIRIHSVCSSWATRYSGLVILLLHT